jgi:hypothetical protein
MTTMGFYEARLANRSAGLEPGTCRPKGRFANRSYVREAGYQASTQARAGTPRNALFTFPVSGHAYRAIFLGRVEQGSVHGAEQGSAYRASGARPPPAPTVGRMIWPTAPIMLDWSNRQV